jgi:integrase
MARKATGVIVEKRGKDGFIYRGLRFTANGRRRYVTLGRATREEAEQELRHVMADVERGIWQPRAVEPPPEPTAAPTFHHFAEEWWLRNEKKLAKNTRPDYRWRLEKHLIDYFGAMPVDAITIDTVEKYIAAKLDDNERIRQAAAKGEPITEKFTDKRGRPLTRRVQPLSPRSINMTVTLLGSILEGALERELIRRNPARGRRRRVRERKPERSYLESSTQIGALLTAAGELDASAAKDRRHVQRKATIATLIFAGLRIGELLALRWRDVDLRGGWLNVRDAKTDAGVRRVKIRGGLMRELARLDGTDGYVFATRTGRCMGAENFRNRVLAAAVRETDKALSKAELPPLPDGLTPHSLRRTFASVLYAINETPPVVMRELGHNDPALALRIYAHAMERGEQENAKLRALVEGERADAAAPAECSNGNRIGNRALEATEATTEPPRP